MHGVVKKSYFSRKINKLAFEIKLWNKMKIKFDMLSCINEIYQTNRKKRKKERRNFWKFFERFSTFYFIYFLCKFFFYFSKNFRIPIFVFFNVFHFIQNWERKKEKRQKLIILEWKRHVVSNVNIWLLYDTYVLCVHCAGCTVTRWNSLYVSLSFLFAESKEFSVLPYFIEWKIGYSMETSANIMLKTLITIDLNWCDDIWCKFLL